MIRRIKQIKVLWLFFSLAAGGLCPTAAISAQAQGTDGIDFSDDDRYDIYFEYELVKGVKILGTKEINAETFLIVTNSNLRGKGSEGYIRFSSIKAILPSGYINALQNPYIQYK